MTNNDNLTPKSGTIHLTVEGDSEELDRLKAMFATGELTELAGIKILSIKDLEDD